MLTGGEKPCHLENEKQILVVISWTEMRTIENHRRTTMEIESDVNKREKRNDHLRNRGNTSMFI